MILIVSVLSKDLGGNPSSVFGPAISPYFQEFQQNSQIQVGRYKKRLEQAGVGSSNCLIVFTFS